MNLLVIDSSVTRKSPAMRAWLAAAPVVLPQYFQQVDVWAIDNELDIPISQWKRFSQCTRFWPIYGALYRAMVRREFAKLPSEYLQNTLVQCTGEILKKCDIRYIHFWNTEFQRLVKLKPELIQQGVVGQLSTKLAVHEEAHNLKTGATGEWWCVSRGIAAPISQSSESSPCVRILPNTYDSLRFNVEVRKKWRTEMRAHYGFTDDEYVLAFSSFGHYERKGLLQAAEAIAKLRESGVNVRLLVLGGSQKHILDFQKKLDRFAISYSGLHFAGLVNEMEKHLSSADGLFFPSHFEAFSLVEIEAAALGLRLYLTEHPGSEMILREGVNGRLLPWDVEGMVDILSQEIREGVLGTYHSEMGEALNAGEYMQTLALHYESAISNFKPHRSL